MSFTINQPPHPWTVADLDTIPEVGLRFEIHEGNLLMISPATIWHSRIMRRVADALGATGRAADLEVGVKRSVRDTRVADVAVFHTPPADLNRAFFDPKELALVVEVVSESSEEDDHFNKPRWYAEGGIDEFWRVEQGEDGEAVIFQHKLARTADGHAAYVETGVRTLSALESTSSSGAGADGDPPAHR